MTDNYLHCISFIYIYIYMYMYLYIIYVYASIYVSIYLCIYLYKTKISGNNKIKKQIEQYNLFICKHETQKLKKTTSNRKCYL